jgi:hypothetical protein
MVLMPLVKELYRSQLDRLPKSGNHIVAQYDARSIVVYQAYRPAIGHFAAEHGYFGGEFKFERMSWIKPNFLWMMYRSGWGIKEGQEVVLAIWIERSAFEEILAAAVHSKFLPEIYASESEWKTAVRRSPVRLQWDPDRHPSGTRLSRRAIQLGLRGKMLAAYAKDWIVRIEDISEFVSQQRQNIKSDCIDLVIPKETVYPVNDRNIAKKLG